MSLFYLVFVLFNYFHIFSELVYRIAANGGVFAKVCQLCAGHFVRRQTFANTMLHEVADCQIYVPCAGLQLLLAAAWLNFANATALAKLKEAPAKASCNIPLQAATETNEDTLCKNAVVLAASLWLKTTNFTSKQLSAFRRFESELSSL